MTHRHLTISTLRQPRPSQYAGDRRADRLVPFLRLRGRWLEELGFEAGSKVAVTASPGRLVITPAPVGEGAADA